LTHIWQSIRISILVAGPSIALLTDFGMQDIFVGVLKGVLSTLAPQANLIDLTHGIPRGDISAGALMLWQSAAYFPPHTVFLCVVDPGVGSARRGIAAVWAERSFVGPDNGLLSFLVQRDGVPKAYLLETEGEQSSGTFHGRDIFAPAASHLAAGLPPQELGPAVEDLTLIEPPYLAVREPDAVEGEALHIDPFGNVVTSIGILARSEGTLSLKPWIGDSATSALEGRRHVAVLPNGHRLELLKTFSDVEPGSGLAYIGSSGLLEIGINQGEAASEFSLTTGDVVQLLAKG
jgi:S-adenosylmethionine hydrolase